MDSSASDVDGTRRGNMDLNNENADDHSASDVSPQESAEHAIIYQEENPLDMSEQFMGTELNPIFSELDPNLEPYLGMEFDSVESAKAFYYAYASQMGFSARKNRSRRSRRDESIIMRRFVCTREGYQSRKESYGDGKGRRKRAVMREGCKAMMEVVQKEHGRWIVMKFVKEHTHIVAGPKRTHLMGSDTSENVIAPTFVTSLPLREEGCQNYMRDMRRDLFGGEAQVVLEYLRRMQCENPGFFYAMQVDNNNCVSNIFWADAKARMAYSCFGDTVTFDTTYKKAKYMMPFATFKGVNHHLQPINFGCALLVEEMKGSYVWLFETWLAAMGGRHPISLTTERDKAMEAGIAKVFPNTRHRFCKWHILNRCKEKLGGLLLKYPNLKWDLKRCVNESETMEEFDLFWETIMDRYDLKENAWMQSLFDIRHQWVPAYQMDTFFAEITTQRPETLNRFFKKYFNTKTSILTFITQFGLAMEAQREKEMQADAITRYTERVQKTPSAIEKQAANVYTRTMFEKFQEEFVESLAYFVDKIEDGVISKYSVAREEDSHRTYIVTYNSSDRKATCSCRKFEYSGILCRHILRVFFIVGLRTLPDEYILKRWTRDAKSSCTLAECRTEASQNFQESLTYWYNDLCLDAMKYGVEGAASVEIYKVAKQALQKAFAEVSAAKSMHRRGQQHLQRFVRAQKISYKRPLPKLPQKRTSAGGAQRSEDNNKRGNKTDDSNKIEEEELSYSSQNGGSHS